MIEDELFEELNIVTRKVGGVQILSEEEASVRLKNLADTYVTDCKCRWWWTSLTKHSKSICYNNTDGLAILATLVEPKSIGILVVTDDSYPPWPMYLGSIENLITVLRECRFFEYFLAGNDGNWIIFDTHMNELVVAGLPGS